MLLTTENDRLKSSVDRSAEEADAWRTKYIDIERELTELKRANRDLEGLQQKLDAQTIKTVLLCAEVARLSKELKTKNQALDELKYRLYSAERGSKDRDSLQ